MQAPYIYNNCSGIRFQYSFILKLIDGLGGHSTEMVRLVEKLDPTRYRPQCYVVANTDKWSRNKVIHSEINEVK